jgi:EmrB/QacA subfamily drug resistance transporter
VDTKNSTRSSPAAGGAAVRSRRLALVVLCVMQLMVILDGTIVTVALPTIQTQLHFNQASLAWVMNGYLIGFAGLLLLAGRLGDQVGSRKVFLTGLAAFTLASLCCGVAVNQAMLVTSRFAQGLGASLASAVILGMIVRLYPDSGEQARAMGIYSFVSAAGASIGLISGGVITQTLGWHWAFLINVPIGVAAFAASLAVLEPDRGLGLDQGTDVIGAALVTVGLSLGVYAINAIADPGGMGKVFTYAAISAVLIIGFVLRQLTARQPMLPLRMFRSSRLSGANLVVVLVFAAGFGFQFLNALYMQRVLGFSSLETGFGFLPGPVMIGVISLWFSAKLVARFGTRRTLVSGLAGIAAGLLLLSRAPVHGSYLLNLLPAMLIMGLGMGLAIPATIMLAMSAAKPTDAGVASGLNNTAQQAGAAVGLATLATLAASRSNALIAKGTPHITALRDGYSLSFLVAAAFVATAVLVALLMIRPSTGVSVSRP